MVALDWEMNFPVENRLGHVSAPPPGLPCLTALIFPHCHYQTNLCVFLPAVDAWGGTDQVVVILAWGLEVGR